MINSYELFTSTELGLLDVYRYPIGKVIPLHAMEAHVVRGGIAPTHS
jgi:hypothetical protein